MKLSQIFAKTNKNVPSDELSKSSKLLIQAGFVHKEMAGVYSYLPLGLKVLKNIENIIREEIELVGGQEVLMTALQPKENWQKTDRWDNFDALMKIKSRYDHEFALGPTHEEIVTPIAKQFISSYKDLPCYIYQIQDKFRDEKRAKSGLLRGREFLMKDLYSFHANVEDLDKYYELIQKTYLKIFTRLGLNALTVEASGGTFSPLSHEFQVLNKEGEDIIYHCKCGFAQNKEIYKNDDVCPKCKGKIDKSNGIEVGNIFKLGTKYSDSFDLTYKDKDGNEQKVIMGCYGLGISRIMGTIVEEHSDENGIVWPKSVAPYQVYLIGLFGKDGELKKKIDAIYENLIKNDISVLYDDREISAGAHFADADLMGLPIRIVVSERTLAQNSAEFKLRTEHDTKLIKISELISKLKE